MKNWKQYALCLGLAFSLTACVPKPDGITRIQYSFWGSLEQQATELEIVKAFEAENPDIKVELIPVGARYSEKIQAMMVGKVAPDVIMVELSQYAEWAARRALVDLTPEMKEIGKVHELMPVPAKAFLRDGKYFACPINVSGVAMYCNLSALKKAGIDPNDLKTWDDIRRLAPRLSKKAGDKNASTDFALLMPPLQILYWGYGAALFDNDLHPSKITANSQAAKDSVGFIREMRSSGYAVPPDIASDQGTYQLFRDGKVALYFDGRWRTPNFAGQTSFDWDVLPVPAGPARQVTQHGGTGLAISKDSKNQEAARKFIRFYISKAGTSLAMKSGRYVPVYRDMAFGDFLKLKPPASIKVFADTMEAGASQFLFYGAGGSDVNSIFGGRMEQALNNPEISEETILEGLELDLKRWLENQKKKGLL